MKIFYDHDLIDEALEAYFSAADSTVMQPAKGESYVVECRNQTFVCIRNNYRVLAVYEAVINGGLKPLEVWPDVIDKAAA
jgi:hypothetical protein